MSFVLREDILAASQSVLKKSLLNFSHIFIFDEEVAATPEDMNKNTMTIEHREAPEPEMAACPGGPRWRAAYRGPLHHG